MKSLMIQDLSNYCRSFSEDKEALTADELEKEEKQELPEYLQLHQIVVRKIGEICRIVNQVANAVLYKHNTRSYFKIAFRTFNKLSNSSSIYG